MKKCIKPSMLIIILLFLSFISQAQTESVVEEDGVTIFPRYLDCSGDMYELTGTAKEHTILHYNKLGILIWRKINTRYEVYCPAMDESFHFNVIFESNNWTGPEPLHYTYHYTAIGDKGTRVIVSVSAMKSFNPRHTIIDLNLKCM